jgi:hypothetical protein
VSGPSPAFRRALWRTLILTPIVACGPMLVRNGIAAHSEPILYDFRGGLYNAAVAILHGHAFYRPAFLAHQVAIMRHGGIGLGELDTNAFSIPVYPAFANLLVVPLALAPFWLAGALFTLASLAAMAGGLWLLGVRDRRCLALALVSWPFAGGALLGSVGPLIVLGAGVAWRWRERLWPAALAVASVVALKIFPWTLGVWLLVTRRYRALALAVAACVAVTLGAWALIGFDGMARYPQMLSEMSLLQEGRAVSVVTIARVLGLSPGAATAIALALAAGILWGAWRLARRPDGDRRAFGLAIIAALTASPIVWEHYMVLLFVPIALASPRLSRLWLAPLVSPLLVSLSRVVIPDSRVVAADSPNALRQAVIWLVIETVVAGALCTTGPQRAGFRARLRLGAHARRPAAAR